MVCSMVKKGLLGAALGAGTLFLVFGTSAPSYVKTAFHKVRQTAKDSIDPRFEIERARTEIASLQPAFDQNKETLARAEVAAERLQKEIGEVQASLDQRRPRSWPCSTRSRTATYRLTGHVVGTADEVKARLANRLDQYNGATESVLKEKQELLKAKQQMIEAAHNQLENLRTQKATPADPAGQDRGPAPDRSRPRRPRASSTSTTAPWPAPRRPSPSLEERLDVMSHKAEIDDKYGDIDGHGRPASIRTATCVKEVDEAFGPAHAPKTGDKSL